MSIFFRKKNRFEEIYDANVEQIYRFLFLKLGSKDEAEDLTSKTFLRVWETVNRENPEGGMKNPRAYAYKIARNLLIDYYRQKRESNIPIDDLVVEDKEKRPDEVAEIDSEMERVRLALKELNDDYQNVIIWHYLNELTIEEIADLMNKSETNVRVTIHRAVSAIKREIEKREV